MSAAAASQQHASITPNINQTIITHSSCIDHALITPAPCIHHAAITRPFSGKSVPIHGRPHYGTAIVWSVFPISRVPVGGFRVDMFKGHAGAVGHPKSFPRGRKHLLVPRDTCACLGQGHAAGGCRTFWKMTNPLRFRTRLWPLYIMHCFQIWRGVAFLHHHLNSLPRHTHILIMLPPWSHCTRGGGGAFMRCRVRARATYPGIG